MAEQNRNGTWSTESQDLTHDIIPDHVFHDMFTDQPPHEFTKMDGSGEVVNPVALAEAGTHELVYCTTKEHLDQIAEEHPATWFLDMGRGGALQFLYHPVSVIDPRCDTRAEVGDPVGGTGAGIEDTCERGVQPRWQRAEELDQGQQVADDHVAKDHVEQQFPILPAGARAVATQLGVPGPDEKALHSVQTWR